MSKLRLTKSSVDSQSQVVFSNVTGTGASQWVSFHYTVNNPDGMSFPNSHLFWPCNYANLANETPPLAGQAHISVNDHLVSVNISNFNSRAGYSKTVPVELSLREGDVNTIAIGAVGSQGNYTIISYIFQSWL